jgi:hypothetical protein
VGSWVFTKYKTLRRINIGVFCCYNSILHYSIHPRISK